jgi:prepilin-type processing-associated H-X9-DG protein
MHSKSRRGGTLIELLMIVAIIGILFALVLPAVQAARDSARRAGCASNVKNLVLSCQQYADCNRQLPPVNPGWVWAWAGNSSAQRPADGSGHVLRCPSNEAAGDSRTVSYGMSFLLAGKYLTEHYSRTPLVADVPREFSTLYPDSIYVLGVHGDVHQGGANVGFGDGRVEFIVAASPELLLDPLEESLFP